MRSLLLVAVVAGCGPRAGSTPPPVPAAAPAPPPPEDPGGAEFLRLRTALADAEYAALPDCDAVVAATLRWAEENAAAIEAVRAWRAADNGDRFRAWRPAHDPEMAAVVQRTADVAAVCLGHPEYLGLIPLTNL